MEEFPAIGRLGVHYTNKSEYYLSKLIFVIVNYIIHKYEFSTCFCK